MSDLFSEDAPQGALFAKLQTGQRLSQSRFALKSEILRTGESSAYWLAQDRDEGTEVVLYFPPHAICSDQSALETFMERIVSWSDSVDDTWHSILLIEPNSKPFPFIVLQTAAGIALQKRLIQSGAVTTWEEVEPILEKVVQHLVQLHQHNQVHGRLSQDNIRFTPDAKILCIAPQLDRIALQLLSELRGNPVPVSWDQHASPECLESGDCQRADEVYALASILLESLRHLGVHVKLPRHIELQGRVRFGNLLVPKNVKQVLMDSLDGDLATRPKTALRLSALLGFSVSDAVEESQVSPFDPMAPDASERTRIYIRSLMHPKCFLGLAIFISIVLGGWMIADWSQNRLTQEQLKTRQALSNTLALDVREAIPSDLNALVMQGNSTLIVKTSPQEALLTLSGPGINEVMEDLSPIEWNQLQEGSYQLSVLAVGHAPTNLYPFLEFGKTNFVEIQLSESLTEIKFVTQPPGGSFRFQDRSGEWVTGLTPAEIPLPAGEYLVHFSLKAQNQSKPLNVKRYGSRGVELVATFGECRLQVYSYPENADVYINDELKGRTPLALDGLASGEIQLELRKLGYTNRSESWELDPENLSTVRWLMQPEEATSESFQK